MILLACAKSTKGKTTVIKKIIQDLQKMSLIMIITDHLDDFEDLKLNDYSRILYFPKTDIEKVLSIIFDEKC